MQVGSSGTVISVEADPRNFKILKKNISMNGMSDRVTPVNKAASSGLGNAKLYYKIDDAYGNKSLLGASDEKNIDIETVSIDSIFTSLSIDRCDVVKIDVEGFEPFVVRGMINTIKSNPNIKIVL